MDDKRTDGFEHVIVIMPSCSFQLAAALSPAANTLVVLAQHDEPEPIPPPKVDPLMLQMPTYSDIRTNDANKAMLRRLHRDMVRRGGRP